MMTIDLSPDALIPFIFRFAIVYGALEVSGVFNRRVNLLVAFVMAFFAFTNPALADVINVLIPYSILFFIGVFFLAFVLKISGVAIKNLAKVVMAIIIVLIGFIFVNSILTGHAPQLFGSTENFIYVAGISIFLAAMYYIFFKWQ